MTRPAPVCPRCGNDAPGRVYVIVAQDNPALNLYPCAGICEEEVRETAKLTRGHVWHGQENPTTTPTPRSGETE